MLKTIKCFWQNLKIPSVSFRMELSFPSSGALMCSYLNTFNDAFKNLCKPQKSVKI